MRDWLPLRKLLTMSRLRCRTRPQVNADASCVHAIVRTTSREVGNASARHHRLGGTATLVHASAADVRALHKSGAHACIGKCLAKRRTRLSGTDDNRLIVVGCAHR